MRRWSSQSNSVRWNRFTGAASISGSAAHPAPISEPRALRRDLAATAENFPQHVMELQALLGTVRAVPGAGLRVPIWLLGSRTFSAQLAAMLGLPFAFASHFAPSELMRALDVYRARFQPSEQLSEPYAMVGVNVFAADTDAEARRLITSLQQQFVSLRRERPDPCRRRIDARQPTSLLRSD